MNGPQKGTKGTQRELCSELYLSAFCAFLWLEAEESLNRGQDAGGGVMAGVVRVGWGGKPLPTFGHDEA